MNTTSTISPRIIQGGMGVAVSGWPLARAVALTGQLGVVSGTALEVVLARRLQLGDPGGHLRRALAHFPVPGVADRILRRLQCGAPSFGQLGFEIASREICVDLQILRVGVAFFEHRTAAFLGGPTVGVEVNRDL